VLALREPRNPQERALQLVLLDTARGQRSKLLPPVPLPDWVVPTVGRGRGHDFRVEPSQHGHTAVLSWHANTFYWGGARPSPERERAARREASGTVTVDLVAGTLSEGGPPVASPAPTGPVEVNGMRAEVVIRQGGDGRELVLKRVRGAEVLPEVVVGRQAASAPRPVYPLFSADRRHLLVAEQLESRGPEPIRNRWTLFSTETGERVAERVTTESYAPFVLWQGYLVYLANEVELRVVKLDTDRRVVSRYGRSLHYGGTAPP
jgi:hypothetical protein